jgi:hypothetical protein
MSKVKKLHIFLLASELAYSPQNESLIGAYLKLDYEFDLFMPGTPCDVSAYRSRRPKQRHARHPCSWISSSRNGDVGAAGRVRAGKCGSLDAGFARAGAGFLPQESSGFFG